MCSKDTLLAVHDLYWIRMGGSVLRPLCSVSNLPKFDSKCLEKNSIFSYFFGQNSYFSLFFGTLNCYFPIFGPFSLLDALDLARVQLADAVRF